VVVVVVVLWWYCGGGGGCGTGRWGRCVRVSCADVNKVKYRLFKNIVSLFRAKFVGFAQSRCILLHPWYLQLIGKFPGEWGVSLKVLTLSYLYYVKTAMF
jgi:hypothetical protein